MEKTMEKIVQVAKARGFVYPGSEIYGGLANTWDYGNLGVELKNNVKRAWWKKFIQENPYNVGVDCAILMNPQTWVASGHLGGFSDPQEGHGMLWLSIKSTIFSLDHPSTDPSNSMLFSCAKSSISLSAQGIFVNLKMCRELPVRKFRLESDRLVSLSVMRLHRVTSHSVRESLSRWSWNFSVSRVPI